MFHRVASLELGSEPWESDWEDITPAIARETLGKCDPGEGKLENLAMLSGLSLNHTVTSLCP